MNWRIIASKSVFVAEYNKASEVTASEALFCKLKLLFLLGLSSQPNVEYAQ